MEGLESLSSPAGHSLGAHQEPVSDVLGYRWFQDVVSSTY